jgi:hypothetical protein
MLTTFLSDKKQLVKGGLKYLKERIAAIGNSFSLAASVLSLSRGLQRQMDFRNLETAKQNL